MLHDIDGSISPAVGVLLLRFLHVLDRIYLIGVLVKGFSNACSGTQVAPAGIPVVFIL